ncbi:hypothetical protein KUTeg_019709 [Tegillarca granosa]|uniref:Protein preY, mitochondrial n=1 Tax=Tegillarca granosa TaxID=220873 RepID=A0ABQ9EJB4_TEGGR|nr:hypothetical protein KUTeg_019709 [Tegillarca granosa]
MKDDNKKRSFMNTAVRNHDKQFYKIKSDEENKETYTFDEKVLEFLVCPLSKKPLRFDKENNELICDEIGVAYPIVNGIPNLVPQDARTIKSNQPININDPS